MATLEVHDSQGRVQFIELSRDHPVLFGTSAACDVALDGEGIRPVHGRIRWKKRRFRVEASPDAEFVLINGTKMASGSLHQGDEVVVGDCRIFLLRNDEESAEDDDGAPSQPTVDGDRTRVISPPVVPIDPATESRNRASGRHSRSDTRNQADIETNKWLPPTASTSRHRSSIETRPFELRARPVEHGPSGGRQPGEVRPRRQRRCEPRPGPRGARAFEVPGRVTRAR